MNGFLQHFRSILQNRIPGQLVIQLTNRCNALCPQCGMRATNEFARSTLSFDAVKRVLDAAAEKGIRVVSFTGGEPLLYLKNLVDLIRHAGQAGIPFIRTGTNGFLFQNSHKPGFKDRIKRLADDLAGTPLRNFWISLDSAYAREHEKMRGLPGVIDGIEKALPIFHSVGVFPSANLGINRRVGGAATRLSHVSGDETIRSACADQELFYQQFRRAFDRFYRMVGDLGFTIVNTCYPMSISVDEQADGLSAVYAATATDDVVRFTRQEKALLYKALLDTLVHHRHRLRIFTPLSALYMLCRQYRGGVPENAMVGCRGGIDFFFIDAQDGNTYPCGYRGNDNLGAFQALDIQALGGENGCRRCDWECFRDPSELFSPILDLFSHPLRLASRLRDDPSYFSLWREDISYYRACALFDGRKPPNMARLAGYQRVTGALASANQKLFPF